MDISKIYIKFKILNNLLKTPKNKNKLMAQPLNLHTQGS